MLGSPGANGSPSASFVGVGRDHRREVTSQIPDRYDAHVSAITSSCQRLTSTSSSDTGESGRGEDAKDSAVGGIEVASKGRTRTAADRPRFKPSATVQDTIRPYHSATSP